MALVCPRCGRQYDITLFEFGRSVTCECGTVVTLKSGKTAYLRAGSDTTSSDESRRGEPDNHPAGPSEGA